MKSFGENFITEKDYKSIWFLVQILIIGSGLVISSCPLFFQVHAITNKANHAMYYHLTGTGRME